MPLKIIAVVLVGFILARVLRHRIPGRRQRLTQVRQTWGMVLPATDPREDESESEAWEEIGHRGESPSIDDQTWSDLNMDAVVAAVDKTHTGLGRQVLYHRMRSGEAWLAKPDLEKLTNLFGTDKTTREAAGVRLLAAGRALGRGFWIITRPGLVELRWWFWLFPFLTVGMLGSIIAIPFEPRFFLVAVALAVMNLVVRAVTAWRVEGILTPMRQVAPLIATAEELCVVLERADLESEVASDLEQLRRLRSIARWISRDRLAVGELVASMWEYLNLFFLLDANGLLFGARQLRDRASVLQRVAAWVGEVDLALSVASLRAEERAWTVPRNTDHSETLVVGMWHPLLGNPVVNDAEFYPGSGMVITGANMSGKSTYLRTIGVTCVLARALNTCPAASWKGRHFMVESLLSRADDLSSGRSYYQVEIDRVVALLRIASGHVPTVFLLDEPLRGTNRTERLAAGEAVLRALVTVPNDAPLPHTAVVATHDAELVSMLAGLYTPWHFCETVGPEGITFDYQRREGPATTRTAIALLKASGASAEIVAIAQERADRLDATLKRIET